MPKHHHYNPPDDTEMISKYKTTRWWAKWISISGIATIAAVLVALPQIKEVFAYGHDMVTAPAQIQTLQADTTAAMKTVQGEINTIQMHEYEDRIWKAKTDERLDGIERLLNRVLDNQERQTQYNPSPKSKP